MRSREGNLHLSRENFAAPTRTMTRTTGLHRMARSDVHQVSKYRRATALTLPAAWGASLDGPGGQDSQLIQSLSLAFRASADVHWMHLGSGMQAVVLARTVEASQWVSHMPRLVVAFATEWPASVLHVNMDRLSPNARGGVGVGTIGKCGRIRFVWYLKVIGVPI